MYPFIKRLYDQNGFWEIANILYTYSQSRADNTGLGPIFNRILFVCQHSDLYRCRHKNGNYKAYKHFKFHL